jgi:hypothetical protein
MKDVRDEGGLAAEEQPGREALCGVHLPGEGSGWQAGSNPRVFHYVKPEPGRQGRWAGWLRLFGYRVQFLVGFLVGVVVWWGVQAPIAGEGDFVMIAWVGVVAVLCALSFAFELAVRRAAAGAMEDQVKDRGGV